MNVALLGFGTVGQGCYKALKKSNIPVTKILDKREFPEIQNILTDNFDDILDDKSIDIVCEMMGGEHPAYDYAKASLLSGKHFVTANKQMLSKHYVELCSISKEKGVKLLFSATAGGGIPWIRNLKNTILVDNIVSITGVMNGTTNFILEKMRTDNMSFEDALKEAQNLGYAEADPTADVKGLDVRAKLAISADVAWDTYIDPEDIPTEGITKISIEDIKKAEKEGKIYRLLAKAEKKDGKITCSIGPCLVGMESPFYNLPGAGNAFLLEGEQTSELLFRGPGAGGNPTGANVAIDILEIARNE